MYICIESYMIWISLFWRCPTFPWLEPEYHRRCGSYRSSSRWDREYTSRYCRQKKEIQMVRCAFFEGNELHKSCVLVMVY